MSRKSRCSTSNTVHHNLEAAEQKLLRHVNHLNKKNQKRGLNPITVAFAEGEILVIAPASGGSGYLWDCHRGLQDRMTIWIEGRSTPDYKPSCRFTPEQEKQLADDTDPYIEYDMRWLRHIASNRMISGYSRMSKAELAERLHKFDYTGT